MLVKFGGREHYLKLQNYYELSKNARKMFFSFFVISHHKIVFFSANLRFSEY